MKITIGLDGFNVKLNIDDGGRPSSKSEWLSLLSTCMLVVERNFQKTEMAAAIPVEKEKSAVITKKPLTYPDGSTAISTSRNCCKGFDAGTIIEVVGYHMHKCQYLFRKKNDKDSVELYQCRRCACFLSQLQFGYYRDDK